MGVKGLWQLLMPVGRRISIETLEGQILAIDASIWLTQFLTVAAAKRERDMDDSDGVGGSNRNNKAYSYDYLAGFLRRLCKLRYQGVRPVLVFDGETPEIKKREVRERMKRRKRKLGDSFYLGGGDGQEDDDALEATRRAAKRILAKQLLMGKLITKNNKNKRQKTNTEANVNSVAVNRKISSISNSKILRQPGTKTANTGSYAAGFYDPKAIELEQQEKHHQLQVNGIGIGNENVLKDNMDDDDDHLLRDHYDIDTFKEQGNDWDNAIIVNDEDDRDDDSVDETLRKNNVNNSKRRNRRKSTSISKTANDTSSCTDAFHAGDGTEFKIETVANLSESKRKDVIEDAMKKRRLASRREFMKVASNPSGLSSCQLQNFLKSTRLNRDISKMAQQAAANAEKDKDEKFLGRNRIIFEKDDDIIADNKCDRNKNIRSTWKRKGKGTTTMIMFHHKDQQKRVNWNRENGNDDNENVSDFHDFRKTNNNHYLSAGIRRFNNDVDDEKCNTNYEKCNNSEKGFLFHGDDDENENGNEIININSNTLDDDNDYDENNHKVINVDSDTADDNDDTDDDDDNAHESQLVGKNDDAKVAQELHDEALARALQTIEEEESIEEGSSDVETTVRDRQEGEVSSGNNDDFLKSSDSTSLSTMLSLERKRRGINMRFDQSVTQGNIFAMNQQNKSQNNGKEVLYPETFDEEEDEVVDWEDGDEDSLLSSKNAVETENILNADIDVEEAKNMANNTLDVEQIDDDRDDDGDDDDDDDANDDDVLDGVVVVSLSLVFFVSIHLF